MGSIALVRCVLVLRCGLAGVVWYPDAGFSALSLVAKSARAILNTAANNNSDQIRWRFLNVGPRTDLVCHRLQGYSTGAGYVTLPELKNGEKW